ncbi:MAG: poly-beta-1,6-N-acetyl-D-glucosamine biosynthesis protein PgaD [Acidobacteriaceae bacterium]
MRAERPIIVRPDKQSWEQRITSRTLSGIAWGVWLMLWMPVLTAVLWIFGTRVTYIYIIRAPDETSLLLIFLIMFICNMIVSGWSSYNYIRFARKTRRHATVPVSHEKVGELFGVTDPETLSLLLYSRILGLNFNEAGVLVRVDAEEVEDSITTTVEAERNDLELVL